MKVRCLKMISDERPSQWEGWVGESEAIYIRYRHGELEVYLSASSGDPLGNGRPFLERRVGNKYDGKMTTDEMKATLADICDFE